MNPNDFLRVAPYINDCPKCKSDDIGEGKGTLELKGDIVTRTCKCGFDFAYDVKNGTTRTKIKKAVKEALDTSDTV